MALEEIAGDVLRDDGGVGLEGVEVGIAKLGRDLYDSIRKMTENFAAMGKSLGASVRNWNELVKQANGRLLTRAEKLKDKGAATGLADLVELATIDDVAALETVSAVRLLPVHEADAAE